MIQKWIIDFLINQAIAYISRWLAGNAPTQVKRSPKPTPIVKPKGPGKYSPIDNAPGHWNRSTGQYNPM